MEPEQFDVYGPHEYSYRGGVEDALSHRSMKTRLRVSGDEALPVINYHVEQVSRQLFENLFFYFMENLPSYGSYQVTVVTASPGAPIATVRKELFDQFTSRLSQEEKDLLGELAGRNVELAFVCFEASSLLGLDLLETIREGMKGKQSEEEVPDALYFDKLKEQLVNLYNTFPELKLQKGEFEGCFCYSKNGVFAVFHKALKSSDMPAIGSSRFNGILKDIGFIEGVNWRNQKDEAGKSVKSLIFTPEIMKSLSLEAVV
jgi:hypothetical protein